MQCKPTVFRVIFLIFFYVRGSFSSLHLFGFYCLKKVGQRLFSTEQALGFARLLSDARGETLVNVCKQRAILRHCSARKTELPFFFSCR